MTEQGVSQKPLDGISVVEVAVGVSELGLGLAGGLPGMLFAELGADVTRVTSPTAKPIDERVPWGRVWHRDKRIVADDDPDAIRALLATADVAFVYGPERLVEERRLGWLDLQASNPGLVYLRCRPSRTANGLEEDYGLLIEAGTGFCTQLAGHRDGPIFADVAGPGSGGAFVLTAAALALLRHRALTGSGGWAETSLYDGLLATLGCMIGRSERGGPGIETYWEKGSWFPNFLYRCSDQQLIQVWFGGKGMYAKLIEVLGDEPSSQGYYLDQASGALNERAVRWRAMFATEPRDVWVARLREAGVACEPVLAPGEALRDPHLSEIGLAIERTEQGHHDVVVGAPLSISPITADGKLGPKERLRTEAGGLLKGLRVVDFSMFVAGPLAGEILADLGAEVIKVEPPQGEAMRGAAYAMAACQRGKRSLAIDINAPEAKPVVERLLRWADVVLHNFRVGVSKRLGIDEETVAAVNPGAVYCHASAFGTFGPRARFPGNDALMQAVTGFEQAIVGPDHEPIAATWIPIDMSGGWVAASGILAGLYARAVTGQGQLVTSSLLGAGMLLHSGVFLRDGGLVRGPEIDHDQTGFGPGYRIYECSDGQWLALVVPDEQAWARLGALPGLDGLTPAYIPLRSGPEDKAAIQAEEALAEAFARAPAAIWLDRLRQAEVPAELVVEATRDEFRRGILDDPLNHQLGRVVAYPTADWGWFEQIGPLLRCGPAAAGQPALRLPGIGEHSLEVLRELGCTEAEISALLEAHAVPS